jgi:galactose mutarotase-like enzyme
MNQSHTVEKTNHLNFSALLLQNTHLKICVVPELGGKITSIQDRATGREWLWQNPYLPAQSVVYDASFVHAYDTGGLDECFPAVSGGDYPDAPWQGVKIPDHGELWCQPWTVETVEQQDEELVVVMSCHGVRFPYRFERVLSLSGQTIQLDYQVTNLTTFDMPFVWSIHPILNIEPGMALSLPEGVDSVRIDGGTNDFLGTSGTLLSWPNAHAAGYQAMDLSQIPAADLGQAVKLYTLPLQGDEWVETAVTTPTNNHAFTFRFNPKEISHIGLWMNYSGWSGVGSQPYFNLGLEPCIGGTDGLPKAKQLDEYGLLPAKKTRRWSLALTIT